MLASSPLDDDHMDGLAIRRMASTAGVEPALSGFVDRCLVHLATSTGLAAHKRHDASAVVKVLVARLAAGRVEAGSEGIERTRTRMMLCACWGRGSATDVGEECCALPAHDGYAGVGTISSSRRQLATES